MNINTIQAVYFIGAGGIGMSALVRYFLSKGKNTPFHGRKYFGEIQMTFFKGKLVYIAGEEAKEKLLRP